MQNNQDLINMFISAASGLLVAALASWVAVKKVFNFEKAGKERDAKNEIFKNEVDSKVGAQNKKIEELHEEITQVKTSTILHIDAGFKAQDKKNREIFPPAAEVYNRFEKLEIARENMFRLVMIEQKNLSSKQDEISDSVKKILDKLESDKDHRIIDLEEKLRGKK